MAANQPNEPINEPAEHSVSSGPARPRRSVTLTVPTWPKIGWRNVANKAKAGGVVVGLLVGLLGGFVGGWVENHSSTGSVLTGNLSNQKKVVTSESQLINAIAKSVGPSVVSVNVDVTSQSQSTFGLFGFSQPTQEQAAGTGIILTSSGLIVTNRHVVPAGTTNVSVTLSDGTQLNDVKVVGRTSSSSSLDIAFLQITNTQGHKLTPATLGNSSQVSVGDEVVAIGNALGQFQNTVTSGIISGYGRSVQASSSTGSSSENLNNLFQTDAAINEGNSGGPLVNLNGQVIGINVAIAGNAQNIGFSIPINQVKGLINQVLKTGKFQQPYIGVRYIPVTADVAQQYNLSVNSGAYIAPSADPAQPSVVPGGPADQAGLKEGDVITQVNGTNVDQNHDLVALLDQYQVGDTIHLTVLRAGKTIDVKVNLGSAPSSQP